MHEAAPCCLYLLAVGFMPIGATMQVQTARLLHDKESAMAVHHVIEAGQADRVSFHVMGCHLNSTCRQLIVGAHGKS